MSKDVTHKNTPSNNTSKAGGRKERMETEILQNVKEFHRNQTNSVQTVQSGAFPARPLDRSARAFKRRRHGAVTAPLVAPFYSGGASRWYHVYVCVYSKQEQLHWVFFAHINMTSGS